LGGQVTQAGLGETIEYFHVTSNTAIPSGAVRSLNYVYYDSIRNPMSEVTFDTDKGVGRFLGGLISRFLTESNISNTDFLTQAKIADLANSINARLGKIKSFRQFAISAAQEDDAGILLSRIIALKDSDGGHLSRAGYGVQFLILVTLSILEEIQTIVRRKRDNGIFEDEATGKRLMSLVLSLDEPEIHLHPYMQRSLIRYIEEIIGNKNNDFAALAKDLFDIDGFIGQIVVVTQSPNMLLDNYREITRFCRIQGVTRAISGVELTPSPEDEKHLYLNFPFFKEAFFSRCVIFVEGDSEYGSVPLFAKRLSVPVSFDDLGISVIQARGSSIPQLLSVAELYGIPCVGMSDRDQGRTPVSANHFVTNKRDFEEEVASIIDLGREATLRRIVLAHDGNIGQEMQANALNKYAFETYNVVASRFANGLRLANISATDMVSLKAFYLTWLRVRKTYMLARLIGMSFSDAEIPGIYRQIIGEAARLAASV
jgi:putative ATP-dependent endonuclease of the OLD family